MKIALTALGTTLESEIDSRFGRARNFLLYETETGALSAIDNSVNLNAVQGAGIQSAGNIAASGAKAVITGHCGPKAFRVLKEAGVKVYTAKPGKVIDAIALFRSGQLSESSDADVEGHW